MRLDLCDYPPGRWEDVSMDEIEAHVVMIEYQETEVLAA